MTRDYLNGWLLHAVIIRHCIDLASRTLMRPTAPWSSERLNNTLLWRALRTLSRDVSTTFRASLSFHEPIISRVCSIPRASVRRCRVRLIVLSYCFCRAYAATAVTNQPRRWGHRPLMAPLSCPEIKRRRAFHLSLSLSVRASTQRSVAKIWLGGSETRNPSEKIEKESVVFRQFECCFLRHEVRSTAAEVVPPGPLRLEQAFCHEVKSALLDKYIIFIRFHLVTFGFSSSALARRPYQ